MKRIALILLVMAGIASANPLEEWADGKEPRMLTFTEVNRLLRAAEVQVRRQVQDETRQQVNSLIDENIDLRRELNAMRARKDCS